MTTGMNAHTGKSLSGQDHLIQSIGDILSTPIGTRVMRREYGSALFEKIDRPITPELLVDIYADVAEALDRWEPRFKLAQVRVAAAEAGRLTLDLKGRWLRNGEMLTLEGIII